MGVVGQGRASGDGTGELVGLGVGRHGNPGAPEGGSGGRACEGGWAHVQLGCEPGEGRENRLPRRGPAVGMVWRLWHTVYCSVDRARKQGKREFPPFHHASSPWKRAISL